MARFLREIGTVGVTAASSVRASARGHGRSAARRGRRTKAERPDR